ncbi:DUF4123 domain-containing protein [Enterovibrio norvegicus]|uniref:DUF4123 domain-containing protein n=1 Tax=Enterovibrio norvegicus TaxID=188144 RepID=A0A2N7L3S8_9GAMM|nr:DUF4123 domain-containing protein [Enterovibrio norvegicus]PMN87963.1 hypothetical protein BCT23_24245 [Enterovibrio norvegicus]
MKQVSNLGSALHNDSLSHYIVANSSPEMASDLYKYSSTSDIRPLYLDTGLSELLAISPYITQIQKSDFLARVFEENAKNRAGWKGIILSVEKSFTFDNLLDFLRHRLFVLFSSERKGVLHFYNPSIANYLIDHATPEDTSKWLGPIRQIHWFGPSHSENNGYWCSFNNLSTNQTELSLSDKAWVLTPSQQVGLEQLYDDKFILSYLKAKHIEPQNDVNFWSTYRGFLRFGEAINLEHSNHLYQLMDILKDLGFSEKNIDLKDSLAVLNTPEKKLATLEVALKKDRIYAS